MNRDNGNLMTFEMADLMLIVATYKTMGKWDIYKYVEISSDNRLE